MLNRRGLYKYRFFPLAKEGGNFYICIVQRYQKQVTARILFAVILVFISNAWLTQSFTPNLISKFLIKQDFRPLYYCELSLFCVIIFMQSTKFLVRLGRLPGRNAVLTR
jgi:hypothetical protein